MHTRHLFPIYALALLLGLFAIGCDSGGDDEASDAELFMGNWRVTSVSDSQGDQTAAFQAGFDDVTVEFKDDDTFTMTVDPVQGDNTVLDGPYAVSESSNTITLTVSFGGQNVPLSLPYTFNGDNEVSVDALAAVLNPLLGTSLTGTATITLTRI